MKPAYMVCFAGVIDGNCVVLKDADGKHVAAKALPIPYQDFARRIIRYGSKRWGLLYAGPGSFHFTRKI